MEQWTICRRLLRAFAASAVAAVSAGLAGCAGTPPGDAARMGAGVEVRELQPLPRQRLQLLRVDLHHPGLRLSLSTPEERGLPLDQMPSAQGALAAVNASFFDRNYRPRGLTRSEGRDWPEVMSSATSPVLACDRAMRCRVHVQPPAALAAEVELAVAGTPWLLDAGRTRTVADDARCPNLCQQRHPRTAVGLSRDGRWLIVLLAEGRHADAAGLTLVELSELLRAQGAHDAINLDGGGSTTLLVGGQSRMQRPANEPSLRRLANALIVRSVSDPSTPVPPAPHSPASP